MGSLLGDYPKLNPEFGIASEVFSREATRFYLDPEAYYESKGIEVPVLAVDQNEEKIKVADKVDPKA
ncbi:hypothetical protein [Peribacillus sp. TH24]|uniref:hypothetical protein n=1 Tax=Peribacillus sp. TH24 TaxID=2798483 RepID=UPI001913CDCF|nr:hypothetical protein [Peribacillus sp. TH24]MBK5442719.1 hypothetical protein [Peribacillus sp. TH24]